MSPEARLFQPIQVGTMFLQHRVVMAPLMRYKSDPATAVPVLPLVKIYYSQRASTPGTLIITESVNVSPEAHGRSNASGAWSDEQIASWKEIVDGVHAHGSFLYMQLRAMGRAADADELAALGLPFVAPSAIPMTGNKTKTPRALTTPEIHAYVDWFAIAARNAVERAGFDGVELHFANGYLCDEFIQDVSNHRTDEYGGSVENRNRFPLEIVNAVTQAVGEERTAVRLSPWSGFLDMGMKDPVPQFCDLVQSLRDQHPNLAFLHLVEPGISGADKSTGQLSHVIETNDVFRKIWAPRPFIVAGGFTRKTGIARAERGDLVAYGRLFIANPDLPLRLKYDIPLNPPDKKTFYIPATQEGTEIGYIDYPFSEKLKPVVSIGTRL